MAFPLRLSIAAVGICSTLALTASSFGDEALPDKIDFQRQIRPILVDRCFACHRERCGAS